MIWKFAIISRYRRCDYLPIGHKIQKKFVCAALARSSPLALPTRTTHNPTTIAVVQIQCLTMRMSRKGGHCGASYTTKKSVQGQENVSQYNNWLEHASTASSRSSAF